MRLLLHALFMHIPACYAYSQQHSGLMRTVLGTHVIAAMDLGLETVAHILDVKPCVRSSVARCKMATSHNAYRTFNVCVCTL